MEILKKQIELVKKYYFISSQNPTRKQPHPYPPSRSSPQTVIPENTPNNSKNEIMFSTAIGGQKQNQVN